MVCFLICCILFMSTSYQILFLFEEKTTSVYQQYLTESRTRSSSLPSTGQMSHLAALAAHSLQYRANSQVKLEEGLASAPHDLTWQAKRRSNIRENPPSKRFCHKRRIAKVLLKACFQRITLPGRCFFFFSLVVLTENPLPSIATNSDVWKETRTSKPLNIILDVMSFICSCPKSGKLFWGLFTT